MAAVSRLIVIACADYPYCTYSFEGVYGNKALADILLTNCHHLRTFSCYLKLILIRRGEDQAKEQHVRHRLVDEL